MKKLPLFFKISIILAVMAGAGFFVFQFFQNTFTRASDSAPHAVDIVDITENSAQITWTTDRESQGVVEYGTSPTSLSFFAPEGEKTVKHTVSLTLLSDNTSYYFRIKVGDTTYDNAGVPWTFSTKGTVGNSVPIRPTEPPVVGNYESCLQETDCDVIKEKISTQECLAIHYSRCLQSKTEVVE